ncbi:MAG: hypothetical protein TREMPRED_006012 [Tremellales sp. Tagirdzhanova-0007]|nr:MAG: hypothetical protein TREMPRED_006012 [Tremellales sp. Tagirdzhanova-0007]
MYDIEAQRRSLSVLGHADDVNAVCFADESSTNILVSGSDDGYMKVWDRRSLSSSTPSGVLVGATEGITYTSPKGDGRYFVVNSKDQAARLYDLRKMRSYGEFEGEPDAVSRPRESTGQSYIYSGSADGIAHIWSLDGRSENYTSTRVNARPYRAEVRMKDQL